MLPPRWSFDHSVAVLSVGCAMFVLVWTFALGIEAEAEAAPGRTLLDRAFPFLLGVGAAAVLLRWAVRSWREGNQAAGAEGRPSAEPGRPQTQPTTPASGEGVGPDGAVRRPLSPDGEDELRRVVAVLGDAAVFGPRVPEPEHLRGPVADRGEPVTVVGVLAALDEADYYVVGFDAAAYSANLAFHVSHGEQFLSVLQEQVDDIVRLAGGALAGLAATVGFAERPGAAGVATTIRFVLDDTEQTVTYQGAAKYLSTVLHVALARLLRARGTGRRLAWVWGDQGVWLSVLPDDALEPLNAALGPTAGEQWEWVDEQEPVAAGDLQVPGRSGPDGG